jgi:hypothetical protein
MNQDAIEKALESLPLYAMLFCGKDGTCATTHGKNGIISIPLSKERELERLAAIKAESPEDPENALAMAFKLHLKGGDAIQKNCRSYHYSRICWSLLMKEAERLRKIQKLP